MQYYQHIQTGEVVKVHPSLVSGTVIVCRRSHKIAIFKDQLEREYRLCSAQSEHDYEDLRIAQAIASRYGEDLDEVGRMGARSRLVANIQLALRAVRDGKPFEVKR